MPAAPCRRDACAAKSCNRSESSRPIVCLKGDLSSHFAFLKRQHVGVLSADAVGSTENWP